jgi:hypothetical protein
MSNSCLLGVQYNKSPTLWMTAVIYIYTSSGVQLYCLHNNPYGCTCIFSLKLAIKKGGFDIKLIGDITIPSDDGQDKAQ